MGQQSPPWHTEMADGAGTGTSNSSQLLSFLLAAADTDTEITASAGSETKENISPGNNGVHTR